MSDQPTHPQDDPLREALRAEAEGVTADPDLLDRIRAATGLASSPWGRRVPWLLAAAAVALVAGLGATLLTDDDGQVVDAIDDPTATSTSPPTADVRDLLSTLFPCADGVAFQTAIYLAPNAATEAVDTMRAALQSDPRAAFVTFVDQVAVGAALSQAAPESEISPDEVPSAFIATFATEEDSLQVRGVVSDLPGVYSSVSTACAPSSERSLPTVVVLLREDGRLVSVDLRGGQERELAFLGDPREDVTGANTINSVSLSPDGSTVYFGTCCPPNSRQGDIWRVPVDASSQARRIAAGSGPAADPSGNWLVIGDSAAGLLSVITTEGELLHQLKASMAVAELDWSPDGRRLAFTSETLDGEEVMLVDFDPETGFSGLRRLAGVTGDPIWLGNDRLLALDRSLTPNRVVQLLDDGTETAGGTYDPPIRDLAASHDRRSVLAVNDDGSVVVQYAEGLPGAGFGAFASNVIAADW